MSTATEQAKHLKEAGDELRFMCSQMLALTILKRAGGAGHEKQLGRAIEQWDKLTVFQVPSIEENKTLRSSPAVKQTTKHFTVSLVERNDAPSQWCVVRNDMVLMEFGGKENGQIKAIKKAEWLNEATKDLVIAPSPAEPVVNVTSIRLEGEQPDPAGYMVVTAGMSDGTERELIRTCANWINHFVSMESPDIVAHPPLPKEASERIFTEGEVQAMLDDMRRMFREFRGHDGTPDGYATIDMMFVDEFSAILRKHKISNIARGSSRTT